MKCVPRRLAPGVVGIAALLGAASAQAQVGSTSGAGSSYANPFLNPAYSPYMNPAAAQGRDAGFLYLLAAQRASGGVGSGMLGGTHATAATASRPAAEMPRSAMVPGGGAARYFQRGLSGGGGVAPPGAYYQRHNRYFGSNGR
jgi:hypothetical protein